MAQRVQQEREAAGFSDATLAATATLVVGSRPLAKELVIGEAGLVSGSEVDIVFCATLPERVLAELARLHNRGAEGVQELAQAFADSSECDLGSVFISSERSAGPEQWRALGSALAAGSAPRLQSLEIKNCSLGAPGARIMAAALRSAPQPQLAMLSLGIRIGPAGAAALAGAFAAGCVPQLQDLSLAVNDVGDAGAAALAEVFRAGHCPQLRDLRLPMNSIGDSGVQALAGAVPQMPSFTALDMTINHIGDAGAGALVDMLSQQSKLRTLAIVSNRFGPASKATLREAWGSREGVLNV